MGNPRPIDKSKKSNHRCVNCESFAESAVYRPDGSIVLQLSYNFCAKTEMRKNYWNCCKDFSWAEEGNYIDSSVSCQDCISCKVDNDCHKSYLYCDSPDIHCDIDKNQFYAPTCQSFIPREKSK